MIFSITFISKVKWFLLLLVPLAFGLYSVNLGQDTNWDLLNYHLYNPYAYLNDRLSTDLAPAGLQTYFNPFLDILYFTAISNLSPKMVGFLLGFIQGLNFILVYKISSQVLTKHKLRTLYSLFLALAGVLSIGFLSEVGTTLNDSLITLFPLLSLWMIISIAGSLNVNQPSTIALIVCSGVFVGIGCGLKLVVSIYALSLCLSFFVLPINWGMRFKLSFLFGVSVLFGLLIGGGYWMFKVWNIFGNPLFPQLNDVFRGELAQFVPNRDIRFLPKTIFEKIFYPVLFTINPLRVSELGYAQVSWIIAYFTVLALLISRVVRFFRARFDLNPWSAEFSILLAFFCISYFLWLNLFAIYRYLIALEMLIPLLIFVAFSHFFRNRFWCWGAVLFIGIITAVNLRGAPDFGHSAWTQSVYRVEPSALMVTSKPVAVYLAGQPLAWLVPALEIKAPFIQLSPNMLVSEAYWQRARVLVQNRDGKSFLVLESDTSDIVERAKASLTNLGLVMDNNKCSHMIIYLGAIKYEYKYCEVKKAEMK